MREIEERSAAAGRYELFTGHLSARNLRLYRRLGYMEFLREEILPQLQIVYLEKLTPVNEP